MSCNICYVQIRADQEEIKCPRCLNSYHKDHLAAWLLNEKTCPICRQQLSEGFRKELMPKTERERQALREISYNLNMLSNTIAQFEKRNKKQRRKRNAKIEEDREKIPWLKIIGPLMLFIIWVIILVALFN